MSAGESNEKTSLESKVKLEQRVASRPSCDPRASGRGTVGAGKYGLICMRSQQFGNVRLRLLSSRAVTFQQ
jgi:hypothetical protein